MVKNKTKNKKTKTKNIDMFKSYISWDAKGWLYLIIVWKDPKISERLIKLHDFNSRFVSQEMYRIWTFRCLDRYLDVY
jgi:hypothetical protein